jgi:hypothetical protein
MELVLKHVEDEGYRGGDCRLVCGRGFLVERAIKNFNELLRLGIEKLHKSGSALTVRLKTGSSRICPNDFGFRGDGMEETVS